jgi:hypothetical protein
MLGFAAQPFVTAALGFSLFPFFVLSDPRTAGIALGELLGGAFAFGLVTGVVGLVLTAILAAPVFLWWRARGPVTLRHAVISGVLIGNVPGALLLGAIFLQGKAADPTAVGVGFAAVRAAMFGSCIGAAAGAVFWRLAGLAHPSTPSTAPGDTDLREQELASGPDNS